MYVCVYVCMHACMHALVYMNACMKACMYNIYILYIYTHKRIESMYVHTYRRLYKQSPGPLRPLCRGGLNEVL